MSIEHICGKQGSCGDSQTDRDTLMCVQRKWNAIGTFLKDIKFCVLYCSDLIKREETSHEKVSYSSSSLQSASDLWAGTAWSRKFSIFLCDDDDAYNDNDDNDDDDEFDTDDDDNFSRIF